ncbi:MAG: c-type cytochrome, partial [Verrucomicrobiae bacterium]|nr:c-type cytochrome [Verrucomicrobiae bacterium]
LRGSDGSSHAGGGEGGNIFHCNRDGGELRRYATGFWNPFGVCVAPGGQVFATDNDPSSRPPSRLHQVIDGGDYGFQYRYGRSGQHPFISWNGELPGTLPMLHPAGEAPCDVIFHRWRLVVASWADHRVEVYPLHWEKTHFTTERTILVQGGVDFRPVAFAFGPNGSLYVTDWVKKDYALHGQGAVWRIDGWAPKSLIPYDDPSNLFAVNLDPTSADLESDPWTFSQLISHWAKEPGEESAWPEDGDLVFRKFALLTERLRHSEDPAGIAGKGLEDPDSIIQLLALKWISDEKLDRYREKVEAIAGDPPSPTLFHAAVTALARLDGQPVDDKPIQRLIAGRLRAGNASPKVKQAAFQVLADREKFLSLGELKELYESSPDEIELRVGVLLTLLVHQNDSGARKFAEELLARSPVDEPLRPFIEEVAHRGQPRPDLSPDVISGRPTDLNVEEWKSFLGSNVSPAGSPALAPGRLVFHRHCAVCHRALGFGRQGGPDLSTIGQRGKDHILASLLDPSAEIAPQFEPWQMTLSDGSERLGFLLGEQGDNHTYADIAGNEFLLSNRDIVTRQQVPVSLMPPGLVNLMSNAELRDLISWLEFLK